MIYADYAATTPVDPIVVQAILPFMTEVFFNASSTHAAGLEAQRAVMKARFDIAKHIGSRMDELIFTSGATEAISLAVLGYFRKNATPQRNAFVTCATEHAAMIDVAAQLEREGYRVTIVGVDTSGCINLDALRDATNNSTLLVSVMAVNNETGVMQDLKALSQVAHDAGAGFMTDATQAYGKMPINVDELGIDLMSFSAHKIYGPKGSGALYHRMKDRITPLQPLQYGGGQEGGIRSGTLNVPGIVGLATAGNIAYEKLESDAQAIGHLRSRFEQAMKDLGAEINGESTLRSYNICNLTLPGVQAHQLMLEMEGICCSQGSACSSAKAKPSHVLSAMGRTPEQSDCSLRFSFGRYSTDADVDELILSVQKAVQAVSRQIQHHT